MFLQLFLIAVILVLVFGLSLGLRMFLKKDSTPVGSSCACGKQNGSCESGKGQCESEESEIPGNKAN